MKPQDTRETLIRRLYDEVWNRGNLAVADELFAEDYQSPTPGLPPGAEGEKQHIAMLRAAFSDLHLSLDQVVASGEEVAARWTMAGTHTGVLHGRAPTGRRVTYWGVHFFRFTGDRITAYWIGVDMLGLFIQLGVLPSPWESRAEARERDA